ncbi:MAG: hypothetical protein Q7K03_11325 [Dehalococcoidia bacterium]|nr:hypothetical protein [Dehalococcoidia bacterium]
MKGRGRLLLKGLVGLACVAYFATSAVVIVNAFVWLPSFPSGWYRMQEILYWPFQPYFALASNVLGRASVPYGVYATVTWSPFLLASIAVAVALLRRQRRTQSRR